MAQPRRAEKARFGVVVPQTRPATTFAAASWRVRSWPCWLLGGFLEQPEQFAVHEFVAGNDLALAQDGVPSVHVADIAAGLAHQQKPGGKIPRRKVALPIGVEPPGRDPGEVEGGGAIAPQAGEILLRLRDLAAGKVEVAAAAVMRHAAGNNGIGEVAARRQPQPMIVEKGTLAAFGDEHLVVGRIRSE